MNYNLSLTKDPSFAILSAEDSFIHLEKRIGQVDEKFAYEVIVHIEWLKLMKAEMGLKGYLQIRKIWNDDKNGGYVCYADYLTDKLEEESAKLLFPNQSMPVVGSKTILEVNIIEEDFYSDRFKKNHRDYYERY